MIVTANAHLSNPTRGHGRTGPISLPASRPQRRNVAALGLAIVLVACFPGVPLFGTVMHLFRADRPEDSYALPTPPRTPRATARRRRPAAPDAQGAGPDDIGASYARFSSDLQDQASVADQQRTCRQRAQKDGLQIPPELEFADEAISGTKADREGLNALMAAARQGRFRRLYFENLSRLARESVIGMPMLKELVYVCRVRIISLTEGIDSATDSWEVLATIFSLQHEQYIKYLSHAVFRGQEGNVLAGFSVGDWCFGYASVPIPGSEAGRRGRVARPRAQYVVDPVTSAWVVRIFSWFVVERRPVRWIARELTRRNAPKDHRATTPGWHHDYVRRVLTNRKYIGVWGWGANVNRRNPLTGKVRQEARSEEECEKWVRHFPHLQIVDNATFDAAQAILRANEEKLGRRRRPNGQLPGSAVGGAAAHPRHLLSGLVRCAACGSRLQVGGAGGKYLFCRNYLKGSCTCKTHLPRERAERMILQAIGERVLANPAWRQAVLNELDAACRREQDRLPTDLQETERTLAAVEAKIGRLVDQVENGTAAPEVAERLAQRRAERKALHERLNRARRAAEIAQPPPTVAWVEEQFQHLHTLLRGGGPAASLALRELVGGQIVVEEVQEPGRQRHWLRGAFTIRTAALAASVRGQGMAGGAPAGADAGEEIVLDFREPRSYEEIADRVKALFDKGVSFADMAAEVGCHRNLLMKALRHWHAQRGLPPPDGRSCRKRLARPSLAKEMADKAKELWDRNLLVREIAERLQCCEDTVTQAIGHWFRSRGLEVPDGRTRRKQLPRKGSPPDEPDGPAAGQADIGAT
jgi:hypothetical protein